MSSATFGRSQHSGRAGNPWEEGRQRHVPARSSVRPAFKLGGTNDYATFGAALFQTLRNFYRTDHIAFTFVSDEFNGVTTDNRGNVRPRSPRTFPNLSAAEEENGQSRIYLGIHWRFDVEQGIKCGNDLADEVFQNLSDPCNAYNGG